MTISKFLGMGMNMNGGVHQSRGDKYVTVLDYIQSIPAAHKWALEVSQNGLTANLELREKEVVSAKCGPLVGNGALLTVASWKNPHLRQVPCAKDVQRNTTISLADVGAELSRQPPSAVDGVCDEVAALKKAILLIYQFRYREAGEKLKEVLNSNRYNYIAWLWYSRIVVKPKSILRTLNEAQKWGNADRSVYLENRRNKALLITDLETVRRCPFCWTVLTDNPNRCSYCCSRLRIQDDPSNEPARRNVIEDAIGKYQRVFSGDRKNIQVAYCLALGYFNLDNLDNALKYLGTARQCSPDQNHYSREIAYLESKKFGKRPVASQQSPPASVQTRDISPPPDGGEKSILVIEDSPTSRKVISMVLKRAGFRILEASSGQEGIVMGRENRPSLILLDVMLPDMSGYEVLPQLKNMPHLSEVPAIMLTGRSGSEDRLKGMRAGSSEYLTKPFNPQKLVNILSKYL